MTPIDIRDTAIPEPVAWQPRYKQEVIDHHAGELWEYAMSVYPTKEGAENYGLGGHKVRPLYPASTVEALTAQLDALKEEKERLRANQRSMHRRAQMAEGAVKAAIGVIDGWARYIENVPFHGFLLQTVKAEIDRSLAKARAALSQPPLPESGESVEGGEWKLVPVDPTEAMLTEINLTGTFSDRAMRARYTAMLAAAPTKERP